MPKVSVIIPVYNVEQYLEQCLQSIINQTLSDIEIICVDDGSTDNSLNILKEYAQKDSRIKVLQQQNQYAGVARNNGLDTATGDYVYFLDSDDYIMKDCLEKMYEQITKTGSDICTIKYFEYDEKTKKFRKMKKAFDIRLLKGKKVFSCLDIGKNIFRAINFSASLKLYKKEFLDKTNLKFQPVKTTNDVFFCCAALLVAEKITYCNKYLMVYRRNIPTSLTKQRGKSFDSVRAAYSALKNFIIERDFPEEIFEAFYLRAYKAFRAECIYSAGELSMDMVRDFFPEKYLKLCDNDNYLIKYFPPKLNLLQKIFSVKKYNNRSKVVTVLGHNFIISKSK